MVASDLFQSAQHPSGLLSRERLVERAGRVGRQIVDNDTDTLGLGKVNVSKFAHAGGEIDCGPALGDFHLAPRPMDVDEHEQIGCSITSIFAIVPLELARLGRDRRANLADELGRADEGRLCTPRWSDDQQCWISTPERIKCQYVSGGDPYAIALSFNLHRRHLTSAQNDLISKVLKARPEVSNATVAKQTMADDKTVAKVRRKLEATSEIPRLEKTTGRDGRSRPATTSRAPSQKAGGIAGRTVTAEVDPAASAERRKQEYTADESEREAMTAKDATLWVSVGGESQSREETVEVLGRLGRRALRRGGRHRCLHAGQSRLEGRFLGVVERGLHHCAALALETLEDCFFEALLSQQNLRLGEVSSIVIGVSLERTLEKA